MKKITVVIFLLFASAAFADGACPAGWVQKGTQCCPSPFSANLRDWPCYTLPDTTIPPPTTTPSRSVDKLPLPINHRLLMVPIEKNLPRDPGAAGDATVAGISTNSEGIRDDVLRAIVYAWPKNTKAQNVGFELARNYQALLVSNPTAADVEKYKISITGWSLCLDKLTATEDANETVIMPLMLDTPARSVAYISAIERWEALGHIILPEPAVTCP